MNIKIFNKNPLLTTLCAYCSVCCAEGKIFMFATNESVSSCNKNCYSYDIEKNEWKQLANIPLMSSFSPGVYCDGEIYLVVAYANTEANNSFSNNKNYFIKYNIEKDKWYFLNNLPYDTALLSNCGTLYVDKPYIYYFHATQKVFCRYNIVDDSWEKLRSSSVANNFNTSLFRYENKLILIGGYVANKVMSIYNLDSNTWTTENLNENVNANYGIVIKDRYYFVMSKASNGRGANGAVVKYLDLKTNKIVTLGDIPNNLDGPTKYSTNSNTISLGNNIWTIMQVNNFDTDVYPVCINFESYVTDTLQTVKTTANSNINDITTLKRIVINSVEEPNTKIRFALSFDGRTTWKVFKDSTWKSLDENKILEDGMTKDEVNALTSDDFKLLSIATNFSLDIYAGMITYDECFSPRLINAKCYIV